MPRTPSPPSIFVPGYTVLDSPAPLLFILHVVDDDDDDNVASFDLTTIHSSFLKDLLLTSFIAAAESLRRVVRRVPSASEFLATKTQVQEGIAAQLQKWNAVMTAAAAAQSVLRRWISSEFVNKNSTPILPPYVGGNHSLRRRPMRRRPMRRRPMRRRRRGEERLVMDDACIPACRVCPFSSKQNQDETLLFRATAS
jgi:hypothetical protein